MNIHVLKWLHTVKGREFNCRFDENIGWIMTLRERGSTGHIATTKVLTALDLAFAKGDMFAETVEAMVQGWPNMAVAVRDV